MRSLIALIGSIAVPAVLLAVISIQCGRKPKPIGNGGAEFGVRDYLTAYDAMGQNRIDVL